MGPNLTPDEPKALDPRASFTFTLHSSIHSFIQHRVLEQLLYCSRVLKQDLPPERWKRTSVTQCLLRVRACRRCLAGGNYCLHISDEKLGSRRLKDLPKSEMSCPILALWLQGQWSPWHSLVPGEAEWFAGSPLAVLPSSR